MRFARNLPCLAALAFSAICLDVSHGQATNTPQRDIVNWPPMNTLSNPVPDANRFLESSLRIKENQKRIAALNLQRQKDMRSETAELVKLAIELSAETDQASKEKLSVVELRKAELIEKLAKNVGNEMKSWDEN
jgi:hypothetical protein